MFLISSEQSLNSFNFIPITFILKLSLKFLMIICRSILLEWDSFLILYKHTDLVFLVLLLIRLIFILESVLNHFLSLYLMILFNLHFWEKANGSKNTMMNLMGNIRMRELRTSIKKLKNLVFLKTEVISWINLDKRLHTSETP